jgi:hypothetical protein
MSLRRRSVLISKSKLILLGRKPSTVGEAVGDRLVIRSSSLSSLGSAALGREGVGVGAKVSPIVVGEEEGVRVGSCDGDSEGQDEGSDEGVADGVIVGFVDGDDDGSAEGVEEGSKVGAGEGAEVGYWVGYFVGKGVGRRDGKSVG